MDFDVLIVGGGASGISCALVLGSSIGRRYSNDKKTGIILHQKSSHLQSAVINNALGIEPGTTGGEILKEGPAHLQRLYPHITQINREKVKSITAIPGGFEVGTNKRTYTAVKVVVAVGYTALMKIEGLEEYVIPHKKTPVEKNRIQLLNEDHLVAPGLYVAGTLAGHRSQYAIACGSGAAVATDILTSWNNGGHTKVHDKLE